MDFLNEVGVVTMTSVIGFWRFRYEALPMKFGILDVAMLFFVFGDKYKTNNHFFRLSKKSFNYLLLAEYTGCLSSSCKTKTVKDQMLPWATSTTSTTCDVISFTLSETII